MTRIQRAKAIEFLEIVTEVEPNEIESCEDYELEAWLYEMDIVWDGNEWGPEYDDDCNC